MGVGRGDRVVLVLPNGPEMAAALLCVASGATCAPLNPDYSAHEFALYLTDLRAKALILQAGMDSPARGVARAQGVCILELSPIPVAEAGCFRLTGEAQPQVVFHGCAQADEVALVIYSTGTTGRPKQVPLTHANLCTSAHNMGGTFALGEHDRCLNVMPLFHIHGFQAALLASLAAGANVVCTPVLLRPNSSPGWRNFGLHGTRRLPSFIKRFWRMLRRIVRSSSTTHCDLSAHLPRPCRGGCSQR
jgi:acyl-CoA synthetase (AMP-forming)/AMP-acid ligase II